MPININDEVHELFVHCKRTMIHPGDLLVCQQNGFIGLGAPCLGRVEREKSEADG